MKKLLIVLSACIMTVSVSFAQDKTELSMIRDLLKKEKRDLVKDYMALDAGQSEKFWPLYDAYSTERSALADNRMKALGSYAKNYSTLTDEQCDQLVKATLDNDAANVKLQKKYYKKLKKTVGATKAAQFLQMETYFQTMIRAEVQDAIPFIGEIERKRG
jgi:hypothetical protein